VLLQKTWEALKRTAEPKIRIAGSAADLSRLGYADQPLRLHDLAIVEIAETGEVFRKEIIMLDVDLVDPTENQLEIGDYIPNIVYINRETARRASGGGGGGGRGQTANAADQSETFAEFAKTNDMIGMVVGTRNGGYYVKAGEIVLAINQNGGTNIKLKADTIDLDGLVLALQSLNIQAVTITAGVSLSTPIANVGILNVQNQQVSWLSETVVTSVSVPTLNKTEDFQVTDDNGKPRIGSLVTGWSPGGRNTKTIHYLGY
jgi:hypothetical protein